MSSRLRILVIENTPSMSGLLTKNLEAAAKFKVELRAEAGGAGAILEENEFDVVFVDLHLREGENIFEGIGIGAEIRKRHPHTVIVMYSGWMDPGKEEDFRHYQKCIEADADAILSREELFSLFPEQLASRIESWVQERKSKQAALLQFKFGSDIRTLAAKEVFEADDLEQVIRKCLPEMKYFKVEALQAGFSGASVLKVKASHNESFSSAVDVVIKVSRSMFALADELKRQPLPGSHFEARSVVPHGQHVTHWHGIHALTIREIHDRTLLRKFLEEPGLTKSARQILSRVVGELLIPPAKGARPWDELGVEALSF